MLKIRWILVGKSKLANVSIKQRMLLGKNKLEKVSVKQRTTNLFFLVFFFFLSFLTKASWKLLPCAQLSNKLIIPTSELSTTTTEKKEEIAYPTANLTVCLRGGQIACPLEWRKEIADMVMIYLWWVCRLVGLNSRGNWAHPVLSFLWEVR